MAIRYGWAEDMLAKMSREEYDAYQNDLRARIQRMQDYVAEQKRTQEAPSIEEGGCDVCDDPNCRHNAHPFRPTEAETVELGDLLDEAMGMAPSDEPEPERG